MGAAGTYGFGPEEVARTMRAFAGLPTVTVEDSDILSTALDLAEKGMDFADAPHLGKAAHRDGMASFDRKFVKAAQAAG